MWTSSRARGRLGEVLVDRVEERDFLGQVALLLLERVEEGKVAFRLLELARHLLVELNKSALILYEFCPCWDVVNLAAG